MTRQEEDERIEEELTEAVREAIAAYLEELGVDRAISLITDELQALRETAS